MEELLKQIVEELKKHNDISQDILLTQAAINCNLACKVGQGHNSLCWWADKFLLRSKD